MSLTTTTLALPVAATDVMLAVTSGAELAIGDWLAIDSEFLQIPATYTPGSHAVPVLRGREGTWAAAHAAGSLVKRGTPQDFEPAPALKEWRLRTMLNPPPAVGPLGFPSSDAINPGGMPLLSRSAAFDASPRTIGRGEDEALVGPLVQVPYNAANFSVYPVASGTWTVPQDPVNNVFIYQQFGRIVQLLAALNNTTLTGTPQALVVAIPPGISQPATQYVGGFMHWRIANVWALGVAYVTGPTQPGGPGIFLYKPDFTNLAAGAPGPIVYFSMVAVV